jgi:transposase InsO family protein
MQNGFCLKHRRRHNLLLTKGPEELIRAIQKFIYYYNNERYHESINNLKPAEGLYFIKFVSGKNDTFVKKILIR